MIRSVARGFEARRTSVLCKGVGQRGWSLGGTPGAARSFSNLLLVSADGATPFWGKAVPPGGSEPQPVTASRAARTTPQRTRRPVGRRNERSSIGLDLHIMAHFLSSKESHPIFSRSRPDWPRPIEAHRD